MQKFKQNQSFDKIFDRLPDHMALLLVILSGFLLARLTWALFPEDPSLSQAVKKETVAEVAAQPASAKDVGQEIAKYHLLGVYKPPKQAPPKVVKAVVKKPPPPVKKSRAPLKLAGVYSLPGNSGMAVINFQGKQRVFAIGDVIKDDKGKESGATLKAVHADSVEIDWGDEIETLKMPTLLSPENNPIVPMDANQETGADFTSTLPRPVQVALFGNDIPGNNTNSANVGLANGGAADIPTAATLADNRPLVASTTSDSSPQDTSSELAMLFPESANAGNNLQGAGSNTVVRQERQSLTASGESALAETVGNMGLGSFRQAVQQNNLNLLQVLKPSPRRESGRLIGFSISPGTNPALFKQTGLQKGDIVTAINGTPLTSNAASRDAMRGLSDSSSAVLNVLRGGQATIVQITF